MLLKIARNFILKLLNISNHKFSEANKPLAFAKKDKKLILSDSSNGKFTH